MLAERDVGELEAAGGVAGGDAGAVVEEDADAGERDAFAAAEDEAGQRGRLDGGRDGGARRWRRRRWRRREAIAIGDAHRDRLAVEARRLEDELARGVDGGVVVGIARRGGDVDARWAAGVIDVDGEDDVDRPVGGGGVGRQRRVHEVRQARRREARVRRRRFRTRGARGDEQRQRREDELRPPHRHKPSPMMPLMTQRSPCPVRL